MGTHMTRALLAQHPDITCYGELTRRLYKKINEKHFGYWNGLPVKEWFKRYCAYDHPTKLAGHTLHAPDVAGRGARNKAIGECLAARKWPVIELRRKNLLRAFASHMIAKRTNAWGYRTAQQHTTMKLHFNERDWKRYVGILMKEFRTTYQRIHRGQPRLLVWYEDTVADYPGSVMRMQEFLGVEQMPFHPKTRQQDKRPIEKVFSNWKKVMSCLSGTKWEGCLFDEPPVWDY